MPTMMPAVMPAHFGGHLLRTVLYRRRGAGIAQRQRLGALGWRGQQQHGADCGKAQNLRNVHLYLPWGDRLSCRRRAVFRIAATQIAELGWMT
jgi:hypothetical protein